MAPLIAKLFAFGATTLARTLLEKGKEKVEEKLGVKLPPMDSEPSVEEMAKLKQIDIEHTSALLELLASTEKVAQENVTKRWEADNRSDSKLAKNVRPGVLVYLTLVFSVMAFFNMQIDEFYKKAFQDLLEVVFWAYFVGRSTEKGLGIVGDLMKKGR